jgi:hypothetical protein
MTKDWVEAKIKEANDKIAKIDEEIYATLAACELLTEEDIQIILDDAAEHITIGLSSLLGRVPWKLFDKLKTQYEDKTAFFEVYEKLNAIMESLPFKEKAEYYYAIGNYKRYLDSDPVEFDGDIIITDPCYVMKHHDRSTAPKWDDYMRLKDYAGMNKEELTAAGFYEDYAKMQEAEKKWDEEHPDDWEVCEYGDRMDKLGFTPQCYMTRDTLYGDWSCTTFDLNTKEEIGGFCADAGLVSVFLLDDILKYNPDYKDHLDKSWCATHIKDFKGTVQFVVKEVTGIREDDTEWWKKGDTWTEYQVEVVGHGVNKATGEPIDFVGTQTGL